MKHLFIAAFLFCSVNVFGQDTIKPVMHTPETNEPIYTIVEHMPEFPGGNDSLTSYLKKNIKYPEIAVKNKTEGKVIVGFIVDTEGRIRGARVTNGILKELNDEALRVVRFMPRWKPGMQKGKPVNVQLTLPVYFTLKEK